MRLTRIVVEGVGRFARRTEVVGLGPGVNILSASNEAGKSTLFAAIRACLFERHSTTNADVKKLSSAGLSLPVSVTLGFAHGGNDYELAKSFIRSPAASLRENGREIARGRDADEKVWELLGLDPGSSRTFDNAAFGLLWVSQGKSFDAPEPAGAAMNALTAAIGTEVETLVGGERARHVLAAVTAQLAGQVTDTGRPRKDGPLDKAQRQVEDLSAKLEAAESRLRELDGLLDDLARLHAERKTLADPAAEARLRDQLSEARKALAAATEAAAAMDRVRMEESHALGQWQAASDQHKRLTTLAERIDANRKRAAILEAELAPLRDGEAAARNTVARALADRRASDEQARRQAEEDRALEELGEAVQAASSREAMAARQAAITAHLRRRATIEAELARNAVDDEAINLLDTIERRRAALDAHIEAAAAQVTIANPHGREVSLNGAPVGAGLSRAVTEPLSITVNGVTIAITPPPGELATARAERDKLDERLAALLGRHGATDAAHLRRLREARRDGESELRALDAERKALGLKDAPAVEVARLDAALARADGIVAAARERHGLEELPSPEDIAARRQTLRVSIHGLSLERERLDGVIAAANEELQRIAGDKARIETELAQLANHLGQDLTALPDDQRSAFLEQAGKAAEERATAHREALLRLQAVQATTPPPDEIERRKSRVQRLEEALANRARQIESVDLQIARLEGRIQTLGGEGLGEMADSLREQLAIAKAELARQDRRVQMLKLLRQTVEDAYARRREQLNAPLKRHLRPFLHDLFPAAEIDLGEGFRVAGLRRASPEPENFERLSKGTQEQIAVLVRLAMGAMLAEKGNEVPVILDDALVFSDDSRIEKMFDALNRAGRNQQVIVFTCRARSFATLGGHQLTIV